MLRILSMVVVLMTVLGAAAAWPRAASATITCTSFGYRSDAQTVYNALGSQFRMEETGGELCRDSGIALNWEDQTPERPERLNGSSERTSLPSGTQELQVEQDSILTESYIELYENVSFGSDNHYLVSLIGVSLPGDFRRNQPQCYRHEAQAHLADYLTQGTTVWMERDTSEDGDGVGDQDKVEAYLWVKIGSNYQMINLALVEQGAAIVSIRPPNERYAGDLRAAQDEAIDAGSGLWKQCRSDDAAASATDPTEIQGPVADCSPFTDYDQAQDYYADHRDEQPVIDPDDDGFACEVFFGVDPAAAPTARPSDSGSFVGSGSNSSDQATRTPVPVVATTAPLPLSGDYQCGDFDTRAEAQAIFEAGGGSPGNDPYGLDSDGDGLACETLPLG